MELFNIPASNLLTFDILRTSHFNLFLNPTGAYTASTEAMPRSRKTNRVPQNTSATDDVLRSTINGSASAWPPHLRGSSSASTPSAIPPHLRGLTTEEAASGGGASAASSTSGEATSRKPAAQKLDEPINPARAFPCTFADCEEAFPSETLLMRHKASPMSGHDYCKICKLDFEDDAAFHLHKMESEAHITCSICSEDFKSEGGLKRHGHQASCRCSLL